MGSRNDPRSHVTSCYTLAEPAAPPLALAFTPTLSAAAALAPKDEGTVLDRSCKELPSQTADFAVEHIAM